MTVVACYDMHGNSVSVAADALIYRPAAYGICIDDGEVLLLRDKRSLALQLPGSVLASGETPAQVVSRAFHAATGQIPWVGPQLLVESLCRVDENGRAWQLSVMYYFLQRPSAAANAPLHPSESANIETIPLAALQRHHLQFGYEAIQVAQLQRNWLPVNFSR